MLSSSFPSSLALYSCILSHWLNKFRPIANAPLCDGCRINAAQDLPSAHPLPFFLPGPVHVSLSLGLLGWVMDVLRNSFFDSLAFGDGRLSSGRFVHLLSNEFRIRWVEPRKAIPMASYAVDTNEKIRAVWRCLARSAVSVTYCLGKRPSQ